MERRREGRREGRGRGRGGGRGREGRREGVMVRVGGREVAKKQDGGILV